MGLGLKVLLLFHPGGYDKQSGSSKTKKKGGRGVAERNSEERESGGAVWPEVGGPQVVGRSLFNLITGDTGRQVGV